jgi:sialate O-acetylesterase
MHWFIMRKINPFAAPGLKHTSVLVVLLCACSWPVLADPVLPGLFSDHMVLQQERAIPMWGWADPGEQIVVTLGAQSRRAVASRDGQWKVLLSPMKAGGPFLMTIRGKKTILIKDVMLGEVWVLSGQSNMTFALSSAAGAEVEIPKANYPEIRLFTVPQKSELHPQHDALSRWKICTPETSKEFSAVGYFFGRELHKKLGVPIGLIHSSWPGTGAEEWASLPSLRSDPQFASILESWQAAPGESKYLAAHAADFQIEFDDFEFLKRDSDATAPFSNFDDGSSRNTLGGFWTYTWKTAPHTTFQLTQPGHTGSGYTAQVSGQLDAGDNATLSASLSPDFSPADMSAYDGIRFHYRGKGYFRLRSLQPTVTDWDDYGTPAFQATPDWQAGTIWFKDLKQDGWGVTMPFTPQALSGLVLEVERAPEDIQRPPAGLFNGMIAPLIPYAIRGAAWYQGESNARKAYQYRMLLPAVIKSWREAWGEGDFQFLIVQLPNYGAHGVQADENAWAELREAQLMALQVPNTGLAVTIDLGEADDLHPHQKAEVGRRLALWALGTTYGGDIVYSGPLYDAMKIENNRIRLSFKHAAGGLEARRGTLRGFAIAGVDKHFHGAEAIIDGNTVLVSSPEVSDPVAVRYAWGGNPDCNLYNQEGLPASPFRTDDWPGVTMNGK